MYAGAFKGPPGRLKASRPEIRCLASSKYGKLCVFPSFSWGGSEFNFQPLAGQVNILKIFKFSELCMAGEAYNSLLFD